MNIAGYCPGPEHLLSLSAARRSFTYFNLTSKLGRTGRPSRHISPTSENNVALFAKHLPIMILFLYFSITKLLIFSQQLSAASARYDVCFLLLRDTFWAARCLSVVWTPLLKFLYGARSIKKAGDGWGWSSDSESQPTSKLFWASQKINCEDFYFLPVFLVVLINCRPIL